MGKKGGLQLPVVKSNDVPVFAAVSPIDLLRPALGAECARCDHDEQEASRMKHYFHTKVL
jgi:hypothetical protein